MLSSFMLFKAAAGLGCFGGAYIVYRKLTDSTELRVKRALSAGDICLVRKGYKGQSYKAYPTVIECRTYTDRDEVDLQLPTGMDPEILLKHMWLFQQTLGPLVEIRDSGDSKTFTVRRYFEEMKTFLYNEAEMKQLSRGLRLPIIAGKSRDGWEVYDMVEHPHLLVAGETGSGKSVTVRQILTTLVLNVPNLELYCADMKRSEFHLFRGVAKNVVVHPEALYAVLMKIQLEMQRRGDLLDQYEKAHVDDLPDDVRPTYIILAVDEVALLKKEKDIMEIIEQISAIGRALGVLLILSMQRPDAKVLDGKLKSNLTVVMAFRHADGLNSRISIDSMEAANINKLHKGRMYLKYDGLKQVQSPFLDMEKAKELLKPLRRPTPKKTSRKDAIDVEYTVVQEDDSIFLEGDYL